MDTGLACYFIMTNVYYITNSTITSDPKCAGASNTGTVSGIASTQANTTMFICPTMGLLTVLGYYSATDTKFKLISSYRSQ